MSTPAHGVTYTRLTEGHWQDVCALFATSRECGLCFCMNHRLKPAEEVLGEDAKAALAAAISRGEVNSILAFSGKECVGWCAVDPLASQPGHDYNHWKHAKRERGIWSVHCLYIHPKFRGQGISSGLIEAAVALAKEKGATEILAFPIPEDARRHFPEHDGEFSGRMSSYRKLGFRTGDRINDFYQVMSLDVAGAKGE